MKPVVPSMESVLAAIANELAGGPPDGGARVPGPPQGVGVAALRERLARFRADPIGGRLLPLKRFAFWFVASAFDRQAKLLEAMLDELAVLEAEVARSRPAEGGGAGAGGRAETGDRRSG
jgi:hypothetical protein